MLVVGKVTMSNWEGRSLGPYEIREEIGHGGMGSVYLAYDHDAEREIAIKLLPPQLSVEATFLERFRQEGRIIARLEHPHILPLYGVGEDAGQLYLVMRYIKGGNLRERIQSGALTVDALVEIIRQVASGLQEAHRQGIIHRDIKPENVLLDHNDNAYLADFGVAKMLDASAQFTTGGGITGTPAYMAPEQWRGESLDARTDVYGLACVVFETMTGERPYTATNAAAFMTRHLNDPAPSVRKLQPNLPAKLDELLKAGMAKDPDKRPATTKQFADSLREALTGSNWSLPMLGGDFSTLPAEMGATPVAKSQSSGHRVALWGVVAVIAVGALAGALALAGMSGGEDDDTELSNASVNFDNLQFFSSARTLTGHSGPVTSLDWSPATGWLASASHDDSVIIWDMETGEPSYTLEGHTNWVSSVSWSPDGKQLVSGSFDQSLMIWNAETGEASEMLTGHDAQVLSVDWSPDGSLLASGSEDGTIIVWNALTGQKIWTLEEHTDAVTSVSWNTPSGLLASASRDGRVFIWLIVDGSILGTIEDHGTAVLDVVYAPEAAATTFVSGADDGNILLFSTAQMISGQSPEKLEAHTTSVSALAWSPDAKYLASASLGGTIFFWARANNQPIGAIQGQSVNTWRAIAWSPNGTQLAAAGDGNAISVYDVTFQD